MYTPAPSRRTRRGPPHLVVVVPVCAAHDTARHALTPVNHARAPPADRMASRTELPPADAPVAVGVELLHQPRTPPPPRPWSGTPVPLSVELLFFNSIRSARIIRLYLQLPSSNFSTNLMQVDTS
jgi:hypothetical protein